MHSEERKESGAGLDRCRNLQTEKRLAGVHPVHPKSSEQERCKGTDKTEMQEESTQSLAYQCDDVLVDYVAYAGGNTVTGTVSVAKNASEKEIEECIKDDIVESIQFSICP